VDGHSRPGRIHVDCAVRSVTGPRIDAWA
jgi:hypothetical protein